MTLKFTVSILLCTAFLLQPLSKLLILVDYEINKAAITQIFCVNKNKPKMNCNGKCHLKKQLEKEDKKQESAPFSSKEKSEIQFFSAPAICELKANSEDIVPNFTYIFPDFESPSASIFHPPSRF